MARNGSFWARGDAGNLGDRLIATKMVQKGLKRTLIAEIARVKMPEQGNFRGPLVAHLRMPVSLKACHSIYPLTGTCAAR
jgi:hypothetical protein